MTMSAPIRIAAMVEPPYVGPCFGSHHNCSDIGFEVDFVHRIFRYLGGDVVITQFRVSNTEEGEEMLRRGQADVYLPSSPASTARLRDFHLTPPVVEESAVFVVRPEPSARLSSNLLFSVSDYRLWLVFAALFALLWLAEKWGHVTSGLPPLMRWDVAVGRTAWYLVTSVVLGTYANFLAITFDQATPSELPFQSYRQLSELLRDGRCGALFPGNSSDDMLTSSLLPSPKLDAGIRWNLEQAARWNPPRTLADLDAVALRIRNESRPSRCLFGVIYQSSSVLIDRLYCDLRVISLPELPRVPFNFLMSRSVPLADAFDSFLLSGSTVNLYQKQFRSYLDAPRNSLCRQNLQEKKKKGLMLGQLLDVFWLGLSGIVLAVVAFAFERVLAKLSVTKLAATIGDSFRFFAVFVFVMFVAQI